MTSPRLNLKKYFFFVVVEERDTNTEVHVLGGGGRREGGIEKWQASSQIMSNGPAAGEMFSATQRVLFGGVGGLLFVQQV